MIKIGGKRYKLTNKAKAFYIELLFVVGLFLLAGIAGGIELGTLGW